MKICLASSWKNRESVRSLAILLRTEGHTVFDFTDQSCKKVPLIPPERFPDRFDPSKHVYGEYLNRPEWHAVVEENKRLLGECDIVVLMLPCGMDAHADAYYALGLGKRLIITGNPGEGERAWVHLWADVILAEHGYAVPAIKELEKNKTSRYHVHVYGKSEEERLFLCGMGVIEATSKKEAIRLGIEEYFDERLRAGSCRPYVEVYELPAPEKSGGGGG